MPASVEVEKEIKCFHCGDTCESEPILFAEKEFCCEGCKTVFEILNQNDLCTYYSIEQHPGLTLKRPKEASQFDYLNDEEIKNKILDFRNNTLEKVTFRVPQVHCASCVWLLENLYKLAEGVTVSQVNFMRKEAYIAYNPQIIKLSEVVSTMASIGYEPEISLHDVAHAKPKKDRSLLYKIGVAGFAFGNVMLFSFPEYLGLDSIMEGDFHRYFGYWNLLLSLPVFFYSAWGYMQSGFISIRKKQLHLDIPIALGIIALFGRSAYEILSHTGAGYVDSLTGLIFFMLSGKWFQNRTYEQLSFERDYKSYFPIAVTKISVEKEESIPVTQIEEGDIIKIRSGEIIPADSILISDNASIDYSFVSGESRPVQCSAGETIYAGGRQEGAAITLQVTKKVSQSYLTRLWNHESFQKHDDKQLTSLADKLSRWFTPLILIIGIASGIYWGFAEDWGKGINVLTAVLIVACPCALALSSPFTLGSAIRILGKQKFYLKNTLAIESIAKINAMVFDKTGTLTLNQESEVQYYGSELLTAELEAIATATAQSGHPISRLINSYLSKNFKAVNKQQTTISFFSEKTGLGIEAQINGLQIKIGSSNFILNNNESEAGSKTYIAINNEVKGYFLLQAKYRNNLETVIEQLNNNHYHLSLISGDKPTDKDVLQEKFGKEVPLYFNQSPHDKLQYIQKLQQNSKHVMMIGDGLNDAGALKQSDIGVAISDNINNFSPACDAILDGAQFEKLPGLLQYCKTSVNMVKVAFLISLLYNVVGVSIAVQGMLSPLFAAIIMPLSSISVVLFGTISTRIAASRVFSEK
jgi:Cu+-exporting ATPase